MLHHFNRPCHNQAQSAIFNIDVVIAHTIEEPFVDCGLIVLIYQGDIEVGMGWKSFAYELCDPEFIRGFPYLLNGNFVVAIVDGFIDQPSEHRELASADCVWRRHGTSVMTHGPGGSANRSADPLGMEGGEQWGWAGVFARQDQAREEAANVTATNCGPCGLSTRRHS